MLDQNPMDWKHKLLLKKYSQNDIIQGTLSEYLLQRNGRLHKRHNPYVVL